MAVSEVALGASDERVLDLAVREGRIFLTEVKDFGQLVYAAAKAARGVIFIRFPVPARKSLPGVVLDLLKEKGEALDGHFVVVQPGRIRISKSPGE
jgi:predicted nuclease of predicted toxin-antitoxin system